MNDLINAAAGIAVVGIPATEGVKRAVDIVAGKGFDTNRFAPIIAILVCVALAFLAPVDVLSSVSTQIGAGICAGLMSCGAWSATKATVMGK